MASAAPSPSSPTSEPAHHVAAHARPSQRFLGRTAIVASVWSLAALPVVFGFKQCTVARVFHQPCPGCGLTRAAYLLMDGHVGASLHMHPLLVPILLGHFFFALSTVHATYVTGTPFYFYNERLGRFALWFLGIVYGLAIVLWIARFFGALGGPVPV